jgi:hypothetical protein
MELFIRKGAKIKDSKQFQLMHSVKDKKLEHEKSSQGVTK